GTGPADADRAALSVQLLCGLVARNRLRVDSKGRAHPVPAGDAGPGPSALMEPTELRAAARDGLATAAERFIRLLETQPHTATPIPGSRWTVRDAAAHLAGGLRRHIDYVHGEGTLAPTLDKEHFSNRT